MTYRTVRRFLSIVILVWTVGLTGAWASEAGSKEAQVIESLPDDTPVAQVADQVITGAQLRARFVREIGPSSEALFPEKKAVTLVDVANMLVRDKMMALEARAQGLLSDPDIAWTLEKTRSTLLINHFVNKVIRPTIKVTDEQIDAQMASSPKMTREQATLTVERRLIMSDINQRLKALLESMHVQKQQDNIAMAAVLYAKLLNRPVMKRNKNMPWVLKEQMLTELTPEQAGLKLIQFDGGAITLLDFMKTIHGMVPVKRPKNLVEPQGVESVLDGSLGSALLIAHIESLGLPKDPEVAQKIREGEDQRLLGLLVSRMSQSIARPTQEEIQARFDEIKGQLTPANQVKVQTIWCQDRETADKAKNVLDQGQPFDQVLENMSLDPKSAGPSHLMAGSETVFWSQISSSEPNQVVGPIQGFYRGELKWRMIKVLEKIDGQPVTLEMNTSDGIYSEIYNQRKEAVLKSFQDGLFLKYDYKIFGSRLKSFDPLMH
ncbi:MAG: peptidyl-prolyl cis-trans isomerase [Phycisphaerae bacterium]|nr:peptidyl-prolyl cis-trans isomerase [Phycisphaerae bacterium]